MTKEDPNQDLDRALAVAREALAISPPAGHADRVAAAALAQPPAPARTWWFTAFPVVWRAAVVLDVAALATLLALSVRAPGGPARPAAGDPIDSMLDDETSAVLTRALHLPSDAEPGR